MAREFADESILQMAQAGDNAFTQDSRLNVKFYLDAIQDDAKSAEEGRPIFTERLMISIAVPGQADCVKRPAWDADFRRFPKHYEAFKAGTQEAETGTPLKMWPVMTVSQVAELAARGVRTVEQLANMADVDAQKFMGLNSLRQKAKDFLEAAKGAAPLTAMRAELESRDAQIASLQAQMTELLAHANKAASKEAKK